MRLITALLPTLALALAAGQAQSHARWDAAGLTPARTNADDIKSGPCGAPRTDNPAVLEAGATVNLKFESTIFHDGDFRIAFSQANDEGFDENILLDAIPDYAGERYRSAEVTLPNVECEQCTLQLIQVMRDRTPPTNYYSCADIQLVIADGGDATAPAAVSGLVAVPGDTSAELNWSHPADEDLAGTLVLQGTAAITAMPVDGQMYTLEQTLDDATVAYSGMAEAVTVGNLPAGATTHFALFAYDDSFNYSPGVATTVDVPEQSPNFPPEVSLNWDQRDHSTGQVDTSTSGLVTITASVTDQNSSDSHTFVWSSSYLGLEDLDNTADTYTFDPKNLDSGMYEFNVTVTDDGTPMETANASVFIEFAVQPNGGGGAAGFWWLMLLALIPLGRHFGLTKQPHTC